MSTYSGSCLCGAVKFEYSAPSLWCAHCHCTLCQRAHGAPLVTWVGVKADGVDLSHEGALCWWPGELHVVRANIHGDIDVAPSGHAYWASHAAWFQFEDDLPHPAETPAD
jgi:hypothetical protein